MNRSARRPAIGAIKAVGERAKVREQQCGGRRRVAQPVLEAKGNDTMRQACAPNEAIDVASESANTGRRRRSTGQQRRRELELPPRQSATPTATPDRDLDQRRSQGDPPWPIRFTPAMTVPNVSAIAGARSKDRGSRGGAGVRFGSVRAAMTSASAPIGTFDQKQPECPEATDRIRPAATVGLPGRANGDHDRHVAVAALAEAARADR